MMEAMTQSSKTLGDSRPLSRPLFSPGTVFAGGYRVVRLLGRGGMGSVYLVEDTALHCGFALKTLDFATDEVMRRRFAREARLMASIKGAPVVRVVRYGEDAETGLPFYVMEEQLLSRGEVSRVCGGLGIPVPDALADSAGKAPLSLASALGENIALREDAAARLGLEILDALEAVHAAGIVHRDLKPSNLLFAPSGRLLFSDFGIARVAGPSLDESTLTLTGAGSPGTPSYAAPEQRGGGEVTAAADYYAFGLVLYRMLTGGLPVGGSASLPQDVARAADRRWAPLLRGLLEREPARRLTDVPAIRCALAAVAGRRRRLARARKALAATSLAVLASGLAAAVWMAAGQVAARSGKDAANAEDAYSRPDSIDRLHNLADLYAAFTNGLVDLPDFEGGELVLKEGQTAFATEIDEAGPSRVVLDGGRICFTTSRAELLAGIDALRAVGTSGEDPLAVNNAVWPRFGRVVFRTPLRIGPGGGKLESDNMHLASVHVDSEIEVDENPGVLRIISGSMAAAPTFDVARFPETLRLAPDPDARYKLVDRSSGKVVRWPDGTPGP